MILIISNFQSLAGQTFPDPAVGLKSLQTMEVQRIELTVQKTTVYLSVGNRIKGGTYCADKNIYLITPEGTRIKMQKAAGIPQCPDSHKFKKEGEILEFSLVFPPLDAGTGWFNIIEECDQNCFSIYGILLNDAFSKRIDEAISYVDKGQVDSAIGAYRKLIGDAGVSEAGITGSLYSDLISLLTIKGYTANAAEWYRKLAASDLPGKQMYIDNLNFRGIKY